MASDLPFRTAPIGLEVLAAGVLHWIVFGLALLAGRRLPFLAAKLRLAGVVLSVVFGLAALVSLAGSIPMRAALFWILVWAGLSWPLLRASWWLSTPAPEVTG
jgi:hypothetical protein